MRIAVVYNEPADVLDQSEHGVVPQAADIMRVLREAGECPTLHAAVSGEGLAAFLARERPDVVFNCCEALRGQAALEMNVAALFELFGIAYTGSPPATLALALDKSVAKSLFQANGISTPRYVVARTPADVDGCAALTRPLIVKPVAEDASKGIDDSAVVSDHDALAQRVGLVWSQFQQAALIEEFIDGRELNVALLADGSGDLEVLPLSEVSFEALPAGMPAIVSYDAKWRADSVACRATPVTCPAAVDGALAERVRSVALAAARMLNVRDYARVDVRVRARDEAVFVLEVNPNPDLSIDAGFMRAAAASGRPFATTIRQILSRAMERARPRAATSGLS